MDTQFAPEMCAMDTPVSVDTDELFYPFSKFAAAVEEHLGRKHGWQVIFARKTDTNPMRIQHWRMNDRVPAWAFDQIKLIDRSDLSALMPKVTWTHNMYRRLRDLMNDRKRRSNREIAALLSKEFNRNVVENAIKAAKFRLQNGKIDL